jgi:hypothetical protein
MLQENEMVSTNINTGPPITGQFTVNLVDGSGVAPNDVIRVSDQFSIDCSWYIDGGLASSLGGVWYVRAAFESIGPGPEFHSDEEMVTLDGRTLSSGPPYTASLVFPPGPNFPGTAGEKVPAGARFASYEVAVILSYTDVAANPGPIAASVNLERLTIYP